MSSACAARTAAGVRGRPRDSGGGAPRCAIRDATRRDHLGHAVRRRASHRVFAPRVSSLPIGFSLRSVVKLTIRADTDCAWRDVPRERGGLIRSRDFRASPSPEVFSLFFFLDKRIKFYLDSEWENRILSFFSVSRSIGGRGFRLWLHRRDSRGAPPLAFFPRVGLLSIKIFISMERYSALWSISPRAVGLILRRIGAANREPWLLRRVLFI